MRPFFSLIIPFHNPKTDYVKQLFDSIARQGIDKDDLEIIAVDDCTDLDSSIELDDIISGYDFNIKKVNTDTDIHCPGNTRRKGMEYVTGEWLCFADQDDIFEDGIFQTVKERLQKAEKTIYCLITPFHEWDDTTGDYTLELDKKSAWLHGKWYSVDYLIKPYHINFKPDLTYCEDMYFNCCVINALIGLGAEYEYLQAPSYRWRINPDSLSRTEQISERGYLYDGFDAYILSTTEPYWADAIRTQDINLINQILMTLLHCYFYYEAASYQKNSADYQDILAKIQAFSIRIMHDFKCDVQKIVDFVYSDPDKFDYVQEDCKVTCGQFICKTSFRDFMFKLFIDL